MEQIQDSSLETTSRPMLTVEKKVVQLFQLVTDSTAGATEALLSSDRAIAKETMAREELVDSLYKDVENLALERLSTLDLPKARVQELIVILRMLPELERSGDLAEHIAWRASRGLGNELTPRARGLINSMGHLTVKMWTFTTKAFVSGQGNMFDEIEELDDELDELHVALTAEIVGSGMPTQVAIELAMVGRFYERLGDHAVNLAKRSSKIAIDEPRWT
jgi:phosphate transport system protein